jgi:predicted nucleotidyltransferase
MSDLKSNEIEALRELTQVLVRDFRLVDPRLFGSKARGHSRPESDIDVRIVVEESGWETQKAIDDICYRLGLEHYVVIAPVVYSRAEFELPIRKITPLYRAVARDGVAL